MSEVKLITLDPGHFHAALIQKEMYPEVSPVVNIYAPLGPDLLEHLNRVARFNLRAERPTSWRLEIHTGPDFFERMLAERPGNVVVLSGRNRGKIDRLKASVEAGLNVLADKPWIISAADFHKLEAALDLAERQRLIAYDMMTERYEIATILQKELVADPNTFGQIIKGTEQEPAVYMESVHHLLKVVAGAPNLRPAWFFDTDQQGEGLADVATHLVDLAQWTLFPTQQLDYRKDIRVISARRWPTLLTQAEFQKVTNQDAFPDFLAPRVKNGRLEYFCNGEVSYAARGIHVRVKVVWNYQPPEGGGDTHYAVFRGTRARLEVRQGKEQNFRPELYVIPNDASERAAVAVALQQKVAALESKYPGIGVETGGAELRVTIPDKYHVGHEAHFAQVTAQFLEYLKNPAALPAWEKRNMLVKYFITTRGVDLSHAENTTPAAMR
jgi:predicted dehydrogenase